MKAFEKAVEGYGLVLIGERKTIDTKLLKKNDGFIEIERILNREFFKLLGDQEYMKIIDYEKFVEMFDLEEKIEPVLRFLLKNLLVSYNEQKDCLDYFVRHTGVKPLVDKLNKEEFQKFIEMVSPGYSIQKVFDAEQAQKKFEQDINKMDERIFEELREIDINKMKKDFLSAAVIEEQEMLAKMMEHIHLLKE